MIMASLLLVVIMFLLNLKESESQTDFHMENGEDTLYFQSHLPIVSIETDGNELSKTELKFASIKVFDNAGGVNSTLDHPTADLSTTIRYRGSTSYKNFDKKQYRLELYQKGDDTKKKKVDLLGMKEETDWVLNGPFLDKTLIRNAMMYELSREMMEWAPDTRFCELVLDEEYQGLYVMTEVIKVSDNRIDLLDFALLNGQTPYLLKRDRFDPTEQGSEHFLESLGVRDNTLSIEYPKYEKMTENQLSYIENDYKRFEKALYGEIFLDSEQGYASVMDVASFVDYYILNEFSLNIDASMLSTFLYKDQEGLMKVAVWDFNNSFDNYPLVETKPDEFVLDQKSWYNRLFMDDNFIKQVIVRYRELRTSLLSEDALLKRIDAYTDELGEAINRNDSKWGYYYETSFLGADDEGDIRYIRSYEEAILQLKEIIVERGRFLDENIEKLYQRSRQKEYALERTLYYEGIMQREMDWIESLQLSNGAFSYRNYWDGSASINPYFNTRTALALLIAHRSDEDIERVKHYIEWYFEHLNTKQEDNNGIAGTIYDYEVKTEGAHVVEEKSLNHYDSVDSYAATFLSLLNRYYQITSDRLSIINHYGDIGMVVGSLEATQQSGLSLTKPDYEVVFLMDNCEVYKGLNDAIELYQSAILGQLPTEELNRKAENELKNLIDYRDEMAEKFETTLWNDSEQRYEVSLDKNHQVMGSFEWEDFYADATSQLFPIVNEVIEADSDRAIALYNQFSSYYQWEKMDHVYSDEEQTYWSVIAYIAALMEDTERLEEYLSYYESNVMDKHESPIYNSDAGWVILACHHMIKHYEGFLD
jgi:hypothetical protein